MDELVDELVIVHLIEEWITLFINSTFFSHYKELTSLVHYQLQNEYEN